MRKLFISMLLIGGIAIVPQINNINTVNQTNAVGSFISYSVALATEEFDRLHLSLKKLTQALASLKEFDKLEQQGLPKRQVQLMKDAMQSKIETMMAKVMLDIQKL